MTGGLPQSITYRDSKGNTGSVRFFLDPGAASVAAVAQNGANIRVAINALTNAALVGSKGPDTTNANAVAYGASGAYENIEDKATFTFADAVGTLHRYQVPAPKSAIFMADGETIDNTNGAVKLFVADMINATYGGTAPDASQTKAAVSRSDQALVTFVGGIRQRRKLHRKMTIYTLNPALTGPDE